VATVLFTLGVACLILAPALVVATFVSLWRVGRSVKAHDPQLWDSMRPGLYGSRMAQVGHSERLRDFFDGHEYESFKDPTLNRFARAYVYLGRASVVALVGAVATVVWACYG